MNIKHALPAAIGMLALSACAQNYSTKMGQIDPAEFGEANRQTMMAQVIDPEPVYIDPLTTSGEHAAQAIERYRTDEVKQPATIETTEFGSGGTGSGTN